MDDNATKDELLERAKELDVKGRSGMNKDELAEAVREAEGADPAATAGYKSEASDLSDPDVKDNLSPSGQEAADMGDESSELADAGLDASGPLHLQSPEDRVMTGAVTEEHAKEQEEKLADKPEDYTGDVSEAGFEGEQGSPYREDGSLDEDYVANMSLKEKARYGLVQPEDVIDFPPPVGLREQAAADANTEVDVDQKAQLQTDGLSGDADHNLGYAYDLGESGIEDQNEEKQEAAKRSDSEASKEEDSADDKSDEGEQS